MTYSSATHWVVNIQCGLNRYLLFLQMPSAPALRQAELFFIPLCQTAQDYRPSVSSATLLLFHLKTKGESQNLCIDELPSSSLRLKVTCSDNNYL